MVLSEKRVAFGVNSKTATADYISKTFKTFTDHE